jgi:hypothetical protein
MSVSWSIGGGAGLLAACGASTIVARQRLSFDDLICRRRRDIREVNVFDGRHHEE